MVFVPSLQGIALGGEGGSPALRGDRLHKRFLVVVVAVENNLGPIDRAKSLACSQVELIP